MCIRDSFLSERKDTRKVFLCLDSDTAGGEACFRLAQDIPSEIAVIRLVPARKDWNDVLRQQGDIPSRKFIDETITLRELPTAQPVPMLRMADVEPVSYTHLHQFQDPKALQGQEKPLCPGYSRFSRMLQMVEEPQPYTSLNVLFLFTPSPC